MTYYNHIHSQGKRILHQPEQYGWYHAIPCRDDEKTNHGQWTWTWTWTVDSGHGHGQWTNHGQSTWFRHGDTLLETLVFQQPPATADIR